MRRRLFCFSFVVNMFSQYFLSFIETKISGQKRVMFKIFFRMICNIDALDLQLSVCTLMSKNCTVCRSGTIELTKLGQLCSSTISLVNEYPKPQKTKPGQICLHNITWKTYKKTFKKTKPGQLASTYFRYFRYNVQPTLDKNSS